MVIQVLKSVRVFKKVVNLGYLFRLYFVIIEKEEEIVKNFTY